jgi:hypothetical protein
MAVGRILVLGKEGFERQKAKKVDENKRHRSAGVANAHVKPARGCLRGARKDEKQL